GGRAKRCGAQQAPPLCGTSTIQLPGRHCVTTSDVRAALLSADPKLSKFSPLPRILAFDEFDSGTHGWTELLGNYNGRGDLSTVDDHMRDFRPPQLSACNFFDIGTHGALSGT